MILEPMLKLIKKLVLIFISAIAAIIIVIASYFICHLIFDKDLIVTSYNMVSEKLEENNQKLRIVQLTDLHNAEIGYHNERLIKTIQEQTPDLIVMTGDMVNYDDPDLSVVTKLIDELSEIADVYFSYGNHEEKWDSLWSNSEEKCLYEILTDVGAIVLQKEYRDITVNGVNLRIGGYSGYYRNAIMLSSDLDIIEQEETFFNDFEDTDRFKILLNHIPTVWLDWDYINKAEILETNPDYKDIPGIDYAGYDVDLVFTGHYHGGVWNLPVIGGVYAPYVGFNPPYYKGVFEGNQATCVLSSGIGNEYGRIPRINNPPEIVVLNLNSNR